MPSIVVHGGAGDWSDEPERLAAASGLCQSVAEASAQELANGRNALNVAEEAVSRLEDSGILSAGKGSRPNAFNEVEMDALLMEGANLQSGAVASVRRVRNPIHLARIVMDRTSHVLLVSTGAEELADEFGVAPLRRFVLLENREWPLRHRGCGGPRS